MPFLSTQTAKIQRQVFASSLCLEADSAPRLCLKHSILVDAEEVFFDLIDHKNKSFLVYETYTGLISLHPATHLSSQIGPSFLP